MVKISQNNMIKRTIAATLAAMLLLLVLGGYFVLSAKQDLEKEKLQYLDEVSVKSATIIENRVRDHLKTIEAIATIISGLGAQDLQAQQRVLQLESQRNEFKRMGIADVNGKAITSDGKTIDVSDREYFRQALTGSSTVSDKMQDVVDGLDINVFATPIFDDKRVVAVLFATQSTVELTHLLEVDVFGSEGYTYIINSRGEPVVYTSHINSIGTFDNLFDEIDLVENNSRELATLKSNIAQGLNGSISFYRQGIEKQMSYTRTQINDWYVVSVVPTSVIAYASNRLLFNMVMAVVGLLVVVLVSGLILLRFFINNSQQLAKMAYHDEVTGSYNWYKFKLIGTDLLAQASKDVKNLQDNGEGGMKKYALVAFDIDNFKVFNDLYGHRGGDALLAYIVEVLHKNIQEGECFCRVANDNFNLLLWHESQTDLLARLSSIQAQIVSYVGDNYVINLSFGVIIPEIGDPDITVLSDRANLARISVKESNKNSIAFFNEEMRQTVLHSKEIENSMEAALRDGEFKVYLQPKYFFADGRCAGAEALVRWAKPDFGLLAPSDFIPILEKNGFIKKLDYYMLEQVCLLLVKWRQAQSPLANFVVSVNLSRVHLSNPDLVEELLTIVRSHDLEPCQIELELTENSLIEGRCHLAKTMGALRDVGFLLAIDDFGSGYSSMNTLKDLPANVLKLDKGFLDITTYNERGKVIIKNLITMAKELHICTVAEGVETVEQVVFLRSVGCDIAQGYYYSRPLTVSDFEKLIGAEA